LTLRRFSKPLLSTTQPPLLGEPPDVSALWFAANISH
jgi:hypothetical protein